LGPTDPLTGALVLPVHTATTFLRDPDNQYRRGRSYGRADNPTYDQPEALLTALEGGAASFFRNGSGGGGVLFASARRTCLGPRGDVLGVARLVEEFRSRVGDRG